MLDTPPVLEGLVQTFTVTSPVPSAGSCLGDYVLTDRIGQGASGIVFRAWHRHLNRTVAIKVFRPEFLSNRQVSADLFQRQVRVLAGLDHPHLVRLWDFEGEQILPCLVMEYVEGCNLGRLIALSGRVHADRALAIVCQVAQGLRAACQLGIVHRALKPANILMARGGTAKVSDLGLAMVVHGGWLETGRSHTGFDNGTADYMAPEQVYSPASVDHRADIYALGSIFYHLVAGQLPFPHDGRRFLMRQRASQTPAPARILVPDLAAPVSALITRMMAPGPADRFETYDALLAALDEVRAGLCVSDGPDQAAGERTIFRTPKTNFFPRLFPFSPNTRPEDTPVPDPGRIQEALG